MFQTLLKFWLIPPAINIAGIIIGVALITRYQKLGKALILLSVCSLWLLSTAFVSSRLQRSIEEHPAFQIADLPNNANIAIVVAGAAHHDLAKEYGVSTPTNSGLERLHYAASLHRRTGAPVLLTGGPMNRRNEVHSEILAYSLENEFKIKPSWLENKSTTTRENALFSADILLPLNIDKILLVTHSYHMKRSVSLFTQAGFTVLPAPTRLSAAYEWYKWRYWMPDASSLELSASVIYEYVALLRDELTLATQPDTTEPKITEIDPLTASD